ncbi:hypothetical protein [Marininema halotolerans]|uniref:Uncharacterized protein n=1 Tax=Marininema halotolerans TaxID=1155944 RepID=A0A1I6R8G3_9BACL|nr:hypothetical protein [Marininema halotolerans]SFS61017.1 hypothetical protein SAMN05444972_104260 [Marininema halotolerans]
MDFFDVVTPLLWTFYVLSVLLSIWAVRKKSVFLLLISMVISGGFSLLAMMSIGTYLILLTVLQLLGLIWVILKKASGTSEK